MSVRPVPEFNEAAARKIVHELVKVIDPLNPDLTMPGDVEDFMVYALRQFHIKYWEVRRTRGTWN